MKTDRLCEDCGHYKGVRFVNWFEERSSGGHCRVDDATYTNGFMCMPSHPACKNFAEKGEAA